MADDAASPEPPEREREASPRAASTWLQANRALALGLGSVALCGVIALDVFLMLRSDASGARLPSPKPAPKPPSHA